MAPLQVFPGEMAGARSADRTADEIGADVRRPDHREQEQDREEALPVVVAQQRQRHGRKPGIAEAERGLASGAADAAEDDRRDDGRRQRREDDVRRRGDDQEQEDHHEHRRENQLVVAREVGAHVQPLVEHRAADDGAQQPERHAAVPRERQDNGNQNRCRKDSRLQVGQAARRPRHGYPAVRHMATPRASTPPKRLSLLA